MAHAYFGRPYFSKSFGGKMNFLNMLLTGTIAKTNIKNGACVFWTRKKTQRHVKIINFADI